MTGKGPLETRSSDHDLRIADLAQPAPLFTSFRLRRAGLLRALWEDWPQVSGGTLGLVKRGVVPGGSRGDTLERLLGASAVFMLLGRKPCPPFERLPRVTRILLGFVRRVRGHLFL